MTNKEILKAVLEKAIDNGYEINQASFDYLMNILRKDDDMASSAVEYYIKENKYFDNIFSHEFAKKFWGEGTLYRNEDGSKTGDYVWEFYLKQMVLAKEPLKYLENFL